MIKKKKFFYGSDGWLFGILNYDIVLLDPNDDIEYISLTAEQIEWLQNNVVFRSYWRVVNDKLFLDIVDPEGLKNDGDIYDRVQSWVNEINEKMQTCGLF